MNRPKVLQRKRSRVSTSALHQPISCLEQLDRHRLADQEDRRSRFLQIGQLQSNRPHSRLPGSRPAIINHRLVPIAARRFAPPRLRHRFSSSMPTASHDTSAHSASLVSDDSRQALLDWFHAAREKRAMPWRRLPPTGMDRAAYRKNLEKAGRGQWAYEVR